LSQADPSSDIVLILTLIVLVQPARKKSKTRMSTDYEPEK
jgi:hypothetical protein